MISDSPMWLAVCPYVRANWILRQNIVKSEGVRSDKISFQLASLRESYPSLGLPRVLEYYSSSKLL